MMVKNSVNMSVDNNNSTVIDVAPCPNEDSLDSREQGNEGDDTLSIVSDKVWKMIVMYKIMN